MVAVWRALNVPVEQVAELNRNVSSDIQWTALDYETCTKCCSSLRVTFLHRPPLSVCVSLFTQQNTTSPRVCAISAVPSEISLGSSPKMAISCGCGAWVTNIQPEYWCRERKSSLNFKQEQWSARATLSDVHQRKHNLRKRSVFVLTLMLNISACIKNSIFDCLDKIRTNTGKATPTPEGIVFNRMITVLSVFM